MKKIQLWMIAAILVIYGSTVLTSCSNDDNNAAQGGMLQITGRWTADVTGATETLWGDGKALRMTVLNSDGTGSTDIYYLLNEDIAVGRSHQTFRYTATADGQLTTTMDDNKATETATWSMANGRLTLKTEG